MSSPMDILNKIVMINIKGDGDLDDGFYDFFIEKNSITFQTEFMLNEKLIYNINNMINKKVGKKSLSNIKWATVFPRIKKIGNNYILTIIYNNRSDYAITNFLLNLTHFKVLEILNNSLFYYLSNFNETVYTEILNKFKVNYFKFNFETSAPDLSFFLKGRSRRLEDAEFFLFLDSIRNLSIIDSDMFLSTISDNPKIVEKILKEYNEGKILSIGGSIKGKKGSVDLLCRI